MKTSIVNLENKKVGDIELSDAIFNVEIRTDIIARVVDWQLAKRRSGNHKTKTRGEISGSTIKMKKQKGSGGARCGSKRVPNWRGGGKAMGPVVRDHEYSLNKKVRKLGLRCALAAKLKEGKLIIIDDAKLAKPKAKMFLDCVKTMGVDKSALFICGKEVDANFALASRNIYTVDVLPTIGANVYDILRRENLVITKEAVKLLEERLA